LAFEAGGMFVATPIYGYYTGSGTGRSLLLVAALALISAVWSPIHNWLYDILELKLAQRVASERPQNLRLLHAFTHEVSGIFMTLPVIMWLGGHGFWEAFAIDFGFTAVYTAYTYLFHLVFDRLRPVNRRIMRPGTGQLPLQRSRPIEAELLLALRAENLRLRHQLDEAKADVLTLKGLLSDRIEHGALLTHDNWGHLREKGRI
jgi:uncharacterized membrane protein